MPVYYPSWVVNIRIKFDETLTLIPPEPPASSIEDNVVTPGPITGNLTSEPLINRTGEQNISWLFARVPKTGNFEKAGYRTAGKFKLSFDFVELPIDPRTIRAAGVEIHTGSVLADDFKEGVRRGIEPGKSRKSVLQTRTAENTPNSATMRMFGVVDTWSVTHDESGSVVTLDGRDLSGILMDTPINVAPGASSQLISELKLEAPIDDLVRQILSFASPFYKDITVVINASEWPKGVIPSPGPEDIIPRHRKGARGKRRGSRGTPNSSSSDTNMSFWDMIVNVCTFVGAVPYFRNLELYIRPSSTVFDKIRGTIDPVRNPTPFAGGRSRIFDEASGSYINPELRSRRLAFGRDIQSLTFDRKFTGWSKPKVVRTVSFNPEAPSGKQKHVVAFYPDLSTTSGKVAGVTSKTPGGDGSATDIISISKPGITDHARLVEIAKSIYEEIGRGEVGGRIETKNLSSFGGGNSDPDLCSLDVGDGIEIVVDTRDIRSGSPLVSSYTNYERSSFNEKVEEIKKILGDENLCRVIVATARGQVYQLQRFFRVQNIRQSWNRMSGISIVFDFQNYIVVRSQAEDASRDPGTAIRKAVGGK